MHPLKQLFKTFLLLSLVWSTGQASPRTVVDTVYNTAYASYGDGSDTPFQTSSNQVATGVVELYDLAFSKQVDTTLVAPGDVVHYTLTVTNLAGHAAPNITVRDTLPDFLTPQSGTPDANIQGQVVSWTLASVAGLADANLTVTALVEPGVPWNTTLDNIAWISTPTDYGLPSNLVQISTGDEPDLTLNMDIEACAVFQGDTLVYTLTAGYSGYFPSQNTLLQDTIPQVTRVLDFTGNGSFADGVVTWNLGTLTSGTVHTETLRLIVDDAVDTNVELRNAGYLTNALNLEAATAVLTEINPPGITYQILLEAEPEYIPRDGHSKALITATTTDFFGDPVPDGTLVTLRTDRGSFVEGNVVQHLTVNGVITDSLSAGGTQVPMLANPGVSGMWEVATVIAEVEMPCLVSEDLQVIFYSASITGRIMDHQTGQPIAGAASQVRNSQNQTVWSSTTNTLGRYNNPVPLSDIYAVTNSAMDRFGRMANTSNLVTVSIPQTDYLGPVSNAGSITGTLLNNGAAQAIPGQKVYLMRTSNSQLVDSTTTSNRGKYAFNGLSPGNYQVLGVYNGSGELFVGTESVPDLQAGDWVMNVDPELDAIAVPFTKTSVDSAYTSGSLAEFVVTVSNPGPMALSDVVVTDMLPPELTFDHANSAGQLQGSSVVWNLGTVLPEEEIDLRLWARTPTGLSQPTQITNTATLTSAELPLLEAQVTIAVTSAPVLDLWMFGPFQAGRGDTITYDFNYSNIGMGTATQVVLRDTLPSEATFVSATGDYTYDAVSHAVSWDLGDLSEEAAGSVHITLELTNEILAGSTVFNGGTISAAEGVWANAAWATVIRGPQLTLELETDTSVVQAGDLFTYRLNYCNIGDTIATNTILTDTLDSRLTFVSATDGGVYSAEFHAVIWQIGDLDLCIGERTATTGKALERAKTRGSNRAAVRRDMGQNFVEVTVRLPSPMENGTILENHALITCGEGVAASVASDAITVTVASQPVLYLEKMGDIEVLPGDTIQYALAYSNIGNMIARNVVLSDSLSDRETFISASGNYAYDAGNRRLRWELGDLSPQEIPDTVYVTARAQLDLPNSAEILNTAYASADDGIFTQSQFVTTNILPITLTLSPDPAVIMGNGLDSSIVTADVRSFLGNPAPDGIPVAFSATEGTISTGYDTVLTENGLAATHLYSSLVSGQAVISDITGIARYSATQTAQDVTQVTFLIGAFEGTIMDYNGEPIEGAVVSLLLVSDESVVGSDTTGTDGYYLIPVDHTDAYQVVYTIYDSEGNATITDQPVTIEVPENGEIVPNLNSISGILVDGNTGLVLNEAGIMVILEGSVDSTYFLSKGTSSSAGFVDTTYTNDDGFYFFTNLLPGDYTLRTEYSGSGSFDNGSLGLSLTNSGTYVVNANLSLTQAQFYTYKRVDQAMAQLGDTLTYRIYYGSALSALPDSVPVWVSDNLPEEVEYLPGTAQASNGLSFSSYDSTLHQIIFTRNGIGHNATDSLIFKTRIRDNLPAGVSFITNTALVYNANDSASTFTDSRSRATTQVIVPYLSVDKRVNKRVAQRGDILTYTVIVQNRSSEDSLTAIDLTDLMPLGFKYKAKTTYCGNSPLGDPLIVQSEHGQQQMIWSLPETLMPGEKCTIKYRAVVGMNAKYGENENYAYASAATPADARTQSAEARATVVIKPGFISDVGFIFGKVYFDLNQNGQHDLGEPTAGDVELITETGIRVITDEFGKYSIPNVRAGRHVLRVNRYSLPERTHVLLNSADFMGDAISRSVEVSPGGMAKANFALEQEVDMAMMITEISTLTLTQNPLTTDFRQVVYKPWRTTFRLGFLSGEAKLRPELFSALRKASDFLRWQKQVIIEIDGHTNNVPISDDSIYKDNFELSKARADAIKQFLVDEMGIDPDRITTHGYGPTRPVASNDTEDGKHLNRRVEMIFHNPEEDLPYDQELRFRVDMVKKGGAKLTDVQFHEVLPAGFTYKSNTASFKGRPLEPVAVTETEAVWALGEWIDEENLQSIEFALEPIDHTRIPTISSSRSHISFNNAMGHRDSTTALQSNMITQIEETLLRINMQEANFDLNSAQLRPDAYIELNKLGDFMVWQQDFTITIKGFTDNTGTFNYNMQLSRNRAESMKDYLLDHFPIDKNRIETSFYGPLYPVAGNETPAGRAKNRRVELLVNSDFQQEFVVKVDASRDSLAYRVLVEHALTDSGMVPQSIALKPGIPAPYLLNLALTDYDDVDSVRVSVHLPEGLTIRETGDPNLPGKASTWVFPVGENPSVFRQEFMLEMKGDETGDNAARFEVLPIMKGQYHGKPLEQTVIVKQKN